MQCLYDFFIQLFGLGIRLAGCRSVKAKALAQGHKHWKEELQTFAVQQKAPVIWFHVASLGEYEQGIQLMESIREHYPSYKILLTFFSPSGYEHCKNNSLADKVCYLP
ncbi:MAG: glycosyltransferase N-terminal domain-containing protein, partial [Bacteroidales bacterium]